ncbi:MAG: CoA-binding protein [Labilithrix sp.]|nr:CoA-binding protein [Labilithrix sp.]MCW5814374.1 CoA-binding protein [Labilithrix sp.]
MDLELLDVTGMERVLATSRTVAVLGIKPDSRRQLDAHQIPLYLQKVGYTIVPVPIRYPEATEILGVRVCRSLTEIISPIDVLSIFVKNDDFAIYVDDVIAVRPGVVWFQSGLLRPSFAERLASAGIPIAEDCIGCRRASLDPSWAPLRGQR